MITADTIDIYIYILGSSDEFNEFLEIFSLNDDVKKTNTGRDALVEVSPLSVVHRFCVSRPDLERTFKLVGTWAIYRWTFM